MDQSIAALEVDKAGGTLTLTGPGTVASFAGTAGTLDPNGQTLECVGNMDWATGFVIADPADSTFEVGGNFTADAQDISGASAEWFLQVDGTAVASGNGKVAHSNANGVHTEIDASAGPWVPDEPNTNTNWNFFAGRNQIIGSSSIAFFAALATTRVGAVAGIAGVVSSLSGGPGTDVTYGSDGAATEGTWKCQQVTI